MNKILIFGILGLALLPACSGTGKTGQSNSSGVTISDATGGFGDSGSALAEAHCAKYGKIAVFASSTGSGFARKYTYLCK